jgi:hypothetical protein
MAYYTWRTFLNWKLQKKSKSDNGGASREATDSSGNRAGDIQESEGRSIIKLAFPERVVRRVDIFRRGRDFEDSSSDNIVLFDAEAFEHSADVSISHHRNSALRKLEGLEDVHLGERATPQGVV